MQHDAAVQPSEPGSEPSRRHGVVTELSFKATFRWVRRAIHEAMDALEAHNLTAEEMASVEIVLAEALNNIVEHAYPQAAPGDVHLSLRLRGTGLLVEVRDQGRPMPNGPAPASGCTSSMTKSAAINFPNPTCANWPRMWLCGWPVRTTKPCSNWS